MDDIEFNALSYNELCELVVALVIRERDLMQEIDDLKHVLGSFQIHALREDTARAADSSLAKHSN